MIPTPPSGFSVDIESATRIVTLRSDGRVLDPAIYEDWMIGGCRIAAMSFPSLESRFETFVDWSRQADPRLELRYLADKWHSFTPAPAQFDSQFKPAYVKALSALAEPLERIVRDLAISRQSSVPNDVKAARTDHRDEGAVAVAEMMPLPRIREYREMSRKALVMAQLLIGQFMPNVSKCFGIDFQLLNETQIELTKALAEQPPIDFNEDVILEPPPREVSNVGGMVPVRVSFDGAEGQGRVWLKVDPQHGNQEEEWIAIEGVDNCRKLAVLLNAWADAYTGVPTE